MECQDTNSEEQPEEPDLATLCSGSDEFGDLKTVNDPYVNSKAVPTLTLSNYQPHLNSKDIGIVMFYIQGDQRCNWSRKHFKQAAEKSSAFHQTFAAVDCVQEFELCLYEQVKSFPYFKLYAKGKEVGVRKDPQPFLCKDMTAFIERYPYWEVE